jgi:Tol biopolymer transport system component/DNA-binding winged helix-turn-helix (wHTH) protein
MSLLINHFYRFGDFTLDTDQRVLLREGKPVAVTPKVFDTLLILVENSGRIVEKEEIMRRLWPDTFVEESNLTFNIQQLRKSLSDNARDPRYVRTVARRGYRFIAEVEAVLSDESHAAGQNRPRFETSDVLSPSTGDGLISQIEAQESGPVSDSANEKQFPTPEKNISLIPADDPASTSFSRRFIALTAATVIVLAGVGLVSWKFSNVSNRSLGEGKRVDGKSSAALPLKLEKLTVTGQSNHVAISPDGKYLAYTRVFKRKVGVWMRQLATNTNVEIVPATDIISGLAFANSGEYLYFVKGDPTVLCRVSLLGGVPTRIVDNLEGKFSVSANDSQIAFIRQAISRDGQREYSLMIANSDGTGERKLLTGTHPDRLGVPLWAPDGESIICAYGNSSGGSQNVTIVEVRVADGMKKELSATRFFQIAKLAWLPHGSGLIMTARKNLGDNNQLWRVSYPGMEISQITEGLISYFDLSLTANADKAAASQATNISDIWMGSSREPKNLKRITQATDNFCWTPSGQLVYSSTASGNSDLWIMRSDGSEQRQLTVSPAVDGNPAVTPDNRFIVFTSNRTSTLQIWRMNLDGSNQIQLTYATGRNFPSISADGKWVLYNSTDDWHLWKVSIDGGEPARLTDYPVGYPSISPDGKMIACTGRNEPKRELSILILPFEGGQPLKRIEFPVGGFSGNRIRWTPDGKALIYTANLGGPTAIIKQSLVGGRTEEIARFDEGELFDFSYSIDGQFLAVTRGAWQHDIVLISDLNPILK